MTSARYAVTAAIKMGLTAPTVDLGDYFDALVVEIAAQARLSPLDIDQCTAVAIAELHICRGGD
jgi:hypothetical protein